MNEREQFVASFREVHPKISRLYANMLIDADLTVAQYAVLTQLIDKETMSMTEVSEKLHVSKPAITNLVDRLEEHRYLKRIPHPNDRRVSLLQIQPKGERIVRDLQTSFLDLLLHVFDTFNKEDQRTISRFYTMFSNDVERSITELEAQGNKNK